MSGFEKFEEELLSKETFYFCCTGKRISDKEYEMFLTFAINHGHDIYLRYDGLLLADVFESFKNGSLKNYWSCPSHYASLPALNWDAILYTIKVKRVEMFRFLTFLKDIVMPTINI